MDCVHVMWLFNVLEEHLRDIENAVPWTSSSSWNPTDSSLDHYIILKYKI